MRSPHFCRRRLYVVSLLFLAGSAAAVGAWQLIRPRYNFPRSERDYYQNDPVLGHRHRAHARRQIDWAEHPKGRVLMQTNNLGMRMNRDVPLRKEAGTRRVLLIGDSHFDGVINNEESFASAVEISLNRNAGKGRWEVLNVAAGYYGPDEYLACLDAYRDLGADCFLIGFYSGNDFLDAAKKVEKQLGGPRSRPWGYRERLRRAERSHAGAVGQMLNQAYYFKNYPDMKEPVLNRVVALLVEMHRRIKQDGNILSVILMPTKCDVEGPRLGNEFLEAAKALELSDMDLRMAAEMRVELAKRLASAGISHWDPFSEMQQGRVPLFWNRDHHLNVAGHKLMADLFPLRQLLLLDSFARGNNN
jgi:hypothetical protein